MNDIGNVRLHDGNFQSQHAAKCDALIKLDTGNIQLAIVDQLQDQVRLIVDHPFQDNLSAAIGSFLDEEALLKFHFRKIKISTGSTNSVFIPADVYTAASSKHYAAFTGVEEPSVTYLRSFNIRNLTATDHRIRKQLTGKLSNPQFYGSADPFLSALSKAYFSPFGSRLFLQFNSFTFEAALIEGKKLLYYNVMDCSTPDELNYFVLMIINQLNLIPGKIPVVLAGRIEEGDELYSRLKKYFPEIEFADSGKLLPFPAQFGSLPGHRYVSLLGLNVCE